MQYNTIQKICLTCNYIKFGPLTWMHSWPWHTPAELRTRRRHKLQTRHRSPWCRPRVAESSEYLLAWLTWPAELSLLELLLQAQPCDPARMTSTTLRLSLNTEHRLSRWRRRVVLRTEASLASMNMFLKLNCIYRFFSDLDKGNALNLKFFLRQI